MTDRRWLVAASALTVTLMAGVASAATTPGSLDTTFSDDGRVATVLKPTDPECTGTSYGSYAEKVDVDAAGRIVVAGWFRDPTTECGGRHRIAVARYLPDGRLDTSFDGDGKKLIQAANFFPEMYESRSRAFVLDGNDIIIAGGVDGPEFYIDDAEVVVVRLNGNGTFDTDFGGGDGIVMPEFGDPNATYSAQHVAMDDQGRLVIAGGGPDGSASFVARLTANGDVDTSFSEDGFVSVAESDVQALTLDPTTGDIIVVTYNVTDTNVRVLRLTSAGIPDVDFSHDGLVTFHFGPNTTGDDVSLPYDVAVQGTKVVVAGEYDHVTGEGFFDREINFGVARLTATGAFDPNFSGNGRAVYDIGPQDWTWGTDVAVAGGKIVLVGEEWWSFGSSDTSWVVARVTSDGRLDTNFGGGDGWRTINVGNNEDTAEDVAIQQSNGRILLTGRSWKSGVNWRFAVARVHD